MNTFFKVVTNITRSLIENLEFLGEETYRRIVHFFSILHQFQKQLQETEDKLYYQNAEFIIPHSKGFNKDKTNVCTFNENNKNETCCSAHSKCEVHALIEPLPKTIFIDIDGTLLKHHGSIEELLESPSVVLDGVKEKLYEWNLKNHQIILTTGRRESMKDFTEKQLLECGITYDKLIMGCTRGNRVIINDTKPNSKKITVEAYNVKRNEGIKELDI